MVSEPRLQLRIGVKSNWSCDGSEKVQVILQFIKCTFMLQQNGISLSLLRFHDVPDHRRLPEDLLVKQTCINIDGHNTSLCVCLLTFVRHWYVWESVLPLMAGSWLADAFSWWDHRDVYVCVDGPDWDHSNCKQLLVSNSSFFRYPIPVFVACQCMCLVLSPLVSGS